MWHKLMGLGSLAMSITNKFMSSIISLSVLNAPFPPLTFQLTDNKLDNTVSTSDAAHDGLQSPNIICIRRHHMHMAHISKCSE